MPMQAVIQGKCTECGESDDNYSIEKRQACARVLKCSCGVRASVVVTEDGIDTAGPISHEDASWNQSE